MPKATMPKDNQTALIEVPLSEMPPGYRPRHLNLQLSEPEAEAIARIREGLDKSNARLKDGRPVYTIADCVRWLLSQV